MSKKKKSPKTNKYDNLSKPQAEFDFHDLGVLTPKEIRDHVWDFLKTAKSRGLNKVIIITGKGLHSKNGAPVVKPTVKKYLESKPFVTRVYEGRRDRGGAGALEVVLDWDQ